MSFPKTDRNYQTKLGKELPVSLEVRLGAAGYANAVSNALHSEYDAERSAVKTVSNLTGANERAVKNWFDAKNGPSGDLLIHLCKYSDHVLETVLVLSGRNELIPVAQLLRINLMLDEISATLTTLRREYKNTRKKKVQ